MTNMTNDGPRDIEARKQLVKDAINEWCDKKLSEFGWWSLKGLMVLAIGALGYYYFTRHGVY